MRFWGGRPSTTEGTAALWAKSLLDASLFAGLVIVLLPWLAHLLFPQLLPIPDAFRTWGGRALFVVGISAWISCLDAFSRRGRGTPFFAEAPSQLVTGGLFGVVRNPLIVAELLVLWGVALYLGSAGVVGYALIVMLAAHLEVVHVEEPVLRERFGAAYEDYCQRVPRWIPRLKRSPT